MSASITAIAKPARPKRRKQRLAPNRRSNGTPYDDLTLVIERAKVLCDVLIDKAHEDGADISLATMLRMEIEDAELVAFPAPADWYES